MASYLIGYDLRSPGQDYSGLFGAIKEISDGWWHNLDSTWIITTSITPPKIRDALKVHLDSNDSLLVVHAERPWAAFKLDGTDWLKDHLD